jgi:hypothetical protein
MLSYASIDRTRSSLKLDPLNLSFFLELRTKKCKESGPKLNQRFYQKKLNP